MILVGITGTIGSGKSFALNFFRSQKIKVFSADDEVKKMIYKINDLEILVKKNSNNSLNFVSDFVSNY